MNLPLLPSRPSCTACSLHASVISHVGVPGRPLSLLSDRTTKSPVLICVGMNPGADEDRANECFVGKSGQILTSVYLQAGSPPLTELADIFALNCCLCSTVGSKPTARQYKVCSALHLLPDLDSISTYASGRPLHLLALGADPVAVLTRNLTGKKQSLRSALKQQGQLVPLGNLHVPLWVSYHPAYVLRYPNAILAVEDHLSLLRAALTGRAPVPSRPRLVAPDLP